MNANYPVLITGAAQRLGLAIAQSLLKQGQTVIVTYRTHKSNLHTLENMGATILKADFAADSDVKQFIDAVSDMTTGLRAVIHNASDWLAESPETSAAEAIQRMMQVHVSAPYQANLAFQQLLAVPDGFTDIIHMTDYVQDTGSSKHIAYAASKAALHNLTLSFSALLAPKTKVNSIAPALLMFNDGDSEEYKRKALNKSLLATCPGAEEAVKAVNYLLDSDYITGRTLHLDGGRHLK